MIDALVLKKGLDVKVSLGIKSIVAILVVVLSLLLPQVVHMSLGAMGGVKWLPMYFPVLIGGCFLGFKWGLTVGAISPLVSFIITSMMGNPMPMLMRLPYMMVELAVFAGVCGAFSKKMVTRNEYAIVAVVCAEIIGRLSFLLMSLLFQGIGGISFNIALGNVITSLPGLLTQAVLASLIIIICLKLLMKEESNG